MQSTKTILAVIAIGAASFGGFFFFLSDKRPAQTDLPVVAKKEEGEKDADARKPKTETPPLRAANPLRRWHLPQDTKAPIDPNDKSQFIQNMAFDPTGTRLTVATQRNAYCFDIASQKALQAYHQDGITMTPDGLQLAIKDKEDLRVVEAATGKEIGKIRLSDTKRLEGKALQQAKKITPTPTAFTVALRRDAIFYQLGIMDPQEFERPNQKLFMVGIGAKTPVRVPCITTKAIPWENDQPLVLSSDESMLLVKSLEQIQVCYWQTDQLLLTEVGACYAYHNPRFTADNSRVIVVRHEGTHQSGHYWLLHDWIPIADSVDLLDIAKRKRTGRFGPPNCKPNTLTCAALSHDWKTLAVADGRTVTLYDAQAAFPFAGLGTK
jgi:hypothetical protein